MKTSFPLEVGNRFLTEKAHKPQCRIMLRAGLHICSICHHPPTAPQNHKNSDDQWNSHRNDAAVEHIQNPKSQNKPREADLRDESERRVFAVSKRRHAERMMSAHPLTSAKSGDATVNIWCQWVATRRPGDSNYLKCHNCRCVWEEFLYSSFLAPKQKAVNIKITIIPHKNTKEPKHNHLHSLYLLPSPDLWQNLNAMNPDYLRAKFISTYLSIAFPFLGNKTVLMVTNRQERIYMYLCYSKYIGHLQDTACNSK